MEPVAVDPGRRAEILEGVQSVGVVFGGPTPMSMYQAEVIDSVRTVIREAMTGRGYPDQFLGKQIRSMLAPEAAALAGDAPTLCAMNDVGAILLVGWSTVQTTTYQRGRPSTAPVTTKVTVSFVRLADDGMVYAIELQREAIAEGPVVVPIEVLADLLGDLDSGRPVGWSVSG